VFAIPAIVLEGLIRARAVATAHATDAAVSEYHEAISSSRARYFTGIITVNEDGWTGKSYTKFSEQLGCAVRLEHLKKLST